MEYEIHGDIERVLELFSAAPRQDPSEFIQTLAAFNARYTALLRLEQAVEHFIGEVPGRGR